MRKNFFTSFYNALSDSGAYYSFQKEMNLKAVEQVFFNSFSGKTSFRAVVLPQDIGSSDALNSVGTSVNTKAIRIRPLNVHNFILPEPCEEKNVERRKKIIAMHPVAYPDETFPVAGGNIEEAVPITTGMVVECTFADGPQGGRLRGLTYRKSNVYTTGINLECLGNIRSNLKDAFEFGGAGAIGNDTPLDYSNVDLKPIKISKGSASKQGPTFTKGACPKALKNKYKDLQRNTTTWFYKYSQEAVIAAIKKQTLPLHVKITMWAFIGIEQPNFNFPNNNPSGIQSDGGMMPGTSLADYDFQTCYRDREKFRAFAGFNTMERGMTVFGRVLASKYQGKTWKTFNDKTNINAAAKILADNYYTGWNMNAKPHELALLQQGKPFTRRGKVYERHYSATKSRFKNKIIQYTKI